MAISINGNGTITGISTGGLPNGCVDTDTLANGAATQAKRTYASGEIIQVKIDTLDRNQLDLTTTAGQPLGSDLEVSITFTSTSNIYYVSVFIPDVWAHSTTGRALHGGFVYSIDNFSSSEILNVFPISDYMGYISGNNADLDPQSWCTSGNPPSTSAMKIRPRFQAVNGDVRIFANDMGVATLTVMEIKA